jgi:hypothetical protein
MVENSYGIHPDCSPMGTARAGSMRPDLTFSVTCTSIPLLQLASSEELKKIRICQKEITNVKQSHVIWPGCVRFYRLKNVATNLKILDIPLAVLLWWGGAGSGVFIWQNFIAVHRLCSSQLYYKILSLDTVHFLRVVFKIIRPIASRICFRQKL